MRALLALFAIAQPCGFRKKPIEILTCFSHPMCPSFLSLSHHPISTPSSVWAANGQPFTLPSTRKGFVSLTFLRTGSTTALFCCTLRYNLFRVFWVSLDEAAPSMQLRVVVPVSFYAFSSLCDFKWYPLWATLPFLCVCVINMVISLRRLPIFS